LQSHAATVHQAVERRFMTLGVAAFSREDLEKRAAAGDPADIRVVGVLKIANDATPELARAAIRSVSVFGKIRAKPEVVAALLFPKSGA
jgi:hypothetical protein